MYQVTQRGGMRASAAVAYLHPALERPNLTVMPYMHVDRVLFEGKRAVGVEASQLGQSQELRAEREVILCGGAYNSPQLLMLSGVGPAEHLAMREVEVLLDQPAVGENLSDHAASYEVWTTPEPESLLLALSACPPTHAPRVRQQRACPLQKAVPHRVGQPVQPKQQQPQDEMQRQQVSSAIPNPNVRSPLPDGSPRTPRGSHRIAADAGFRTAVSTISGEARRPAQVGP